MSPFKKYAIGAGAAILLSLFFLDGWLMWLVILGVIGLPVVGYLMLDPSQRERLKRSRRRGIGR